MRFSIIIPAHNEEHYLGRCLDSIDRARMFHPCSCEILVVANRCTDTTETIALSRGARVLHDDECNLSHIRNTGARAAQGEILVTIDADSAMSTNMLAEIDRVLSSGRYIGGGVPIRTERLSFGILATGVFFLFYFLKTRLAGGLFWCFRRDFEAVGGFNEKIFIAEDLDFARRLRAYGQRRKLRFGMLWRTHICTSCRKFDRFGDWFMLRMILTHPRRFLRALHGHDPALAEQLYYNFKR